MKSIEIYTVRSAKVIKGSFANIDQAELMRAVWGMKRFETTTEELYTSNKIEAESICCHEENGEFFVMNENGDEICRFTVWVSVADQLEMIESAFVEAESVIEEHHEVFIGKVPLKELKLTNGMIKDINNEIENWKARTANA